jgi:hypothetical protein
MSTIRLQTIGPGILVALCLTAFRTVFVSDHVAALAAEPDGGKERAARAVEEAADEVKRFAFRLESSVDGSLDLLPTPVFRYTNPLRGEVYSTIFIWTHKGRPEVIASVSSWHSPRRWLGLAVTSLSAEKVVGTRDDEEVWRPQSAGIEFRAIPGAPGPGDTPANRLRQMGLLARQFTAEFKRDATVPEGGKLRLLSRPFHRYDSPANQVLDGAIFGLADGTAPHLLLLIEARQAGRTVRWEYALAPKNSVEYHVWHHDDEVWSLRQLAPPWRNSKNPTHTYTVFPDLGDESRTKELADELAKAMRQLRSASKSDAGK